MSTYAEPMMPLVGSVFASPITVPDDTNHLVIYDEFAIEIARLKSADMRGFLGPNHLIVNSPTEIWSFKEQGEEGVTIEEVEPELVVFQIGTSNFIRHDYPPYGVVYDERNIVYFLGVDQPSAVKVAEGNGLGLGKEK